MKDIFEKEFDRVWLRFCYLYPSLHQFTRPTLVISNRLTKSVGYNRPLDNMIVMSAKLWVIKANQTEILEHWIPHEIAHQVDYNLNGMPNNNRWHGPRWQNIMLTYGLVPSTYHDLQTV